MKTTVALFLVLCLLAVQANPSGEGGAGAGAGTGADSGNDGGTGAGAGSGSDRGSGAGAASGSDGGAGAGAGSGSDGEAGAGPGSGSDDGSGDGYFRSTYITNRIHLKQMLFEAGDKLVMIYFMATQCSPCQIFNPQLYKLGKEFADSVIVLTVDKDKALGVTIDYNIKGVPTFVFVKNFKKLAELYGAHYEDLRTTILRLK